jgi:hypothetical protein
MFSVTFFKNHHSPTLTHSVARFHTHITYNLSATSMPLNKAVMLENHSWCWTVNTMTCFINSDTTSYQVPILKCIQTTLCLLHHWPGQGSLIHRNTESIMISHDSCGFWSELKETMYLPILFSNAKLVCTSMCATSIKSKPVYISFILK